MLTIRTANAIGKYLMTIVFVEAQFLCFEYLKKRNDVTYLEKVTYP